MALTTVAAILRPSTQKLSSHHSYHLHLNSDWVKTWEPELGTGARLGVDLGLGSGTEVPDTSDP